MAKLTYLIGDATQPIIRENEYSVIVHCCNTLGAWGAGFVIPLAKRYPNARSSYFNYIHKKTFLEYCSYYVSYRHSRKHEGDGKHINYIAARPNPGAGIGHQMANWMAGYHLAKALKFKFAHILLFI